MARNSAFLFIKPHAITSEVKALVKKVLDAKSISIEAEGSLLGREISDKQLIDKHYYSIASKATLLKPSELNVPKDKFCSFFGLGWEEALEAGNVLNAKDACAKLGLSAGEFEKEWRNAEKLGKSVKFGGGFYCAKMEVGGHDMFVFNGFFMAMRQKYVAEEAAIHWFDVNWDPSDCNWGSFRTDVLGATDPSKAAVDSLRGQIFKDWKVLGLPALPSGPDNGIHASASPFEALSEKMNWLGRPVEDDKFGQMLLKAGIPKETICAWSIDPQVKYGEPPAEPKSLFDSLEDLDCEACVDMCSTIQAGEVSSKKQKTEA